MKNAAPIANMVLEDIPITVVWGNEKWLAANLATLSAIESKDLDCLTPWTSTAVYHCHCQLLHRAKLVLWYEP